MVAAAPAALAAMVLVGGRSSSGGAESNGPIETALTLWAAAGIRARTGPSGPRGAGIDVRDRASIRVVAEFDMPDFMRDQKGLVEGRTDPRRPRRCVVGGVLAGVTGPGSTPSTCLRRKRSCDRS